VAELETTKW